ncbi:MAG: hypothetical protein QXT38_02370 [Candidatus Aenigmatarchaeota archaeon]
MYIIIFQLPAKDPIIKLKVNRFLKKIGAKIVFKGVWRHQDEVQLIGLASWIRNLGGKAYVLEEKIIY